MSYRIALNDDQENSFSCRDDETILEAALAAGINIPYSCRQGNCKSCVVKKLSGEIDYAKDELFQESEQDIVSCQAYPLTDIVLELDVRAINAGISVKTLPTRIISIEKRKNTTILQLKLPSHEKFVFLPGQYLNILLKNNQKRSYSIASKPEESYLELHIKHYKNGLFSDNLLTNAKVGDLLKIEGPLGNFSWHSDAYPVLLIASGTGFAPICSMLKTYLPSSKQPIHFHWIVKEKEDFYSSLPEEWKTTYDNFSFFPFIREQQANFIHKTLFEQYPDLKNFHIYLCGSEKMIEITSKALLEKNFPQEQLFIDKFLPTGSY